MTTKTVIGSGVSGAATVAALADSPLAEALTDGGSTLKAISSHGTWLALAAVVLLIAGVGLTIYGRWRVRNKTGE